MLNNYFAYTRKNIKMDEHECFIHLYKKVHNSFTKFLITLAPVLNTKWLFVLLQPCKYNKH